VNLRIIVFLVISVTSIKGYPETDTLAINSLYSNLNSNDTGKLSLGIIAGWHQWKYVFGEIGIGIGKSDRGYHGIMFHAVSFSLELRPFSNVHAYKVSIWKSIPLIPLSLGINCVRYQKLNAHDWAIRPMLGIGIKNIHFIYSYDLRLGNRDVLERNSHMLSVRYFLPLMKFK
jgi:hypothetical protein